MNKADFIALRNKVPNFLYKLTNLSKQGFLNQVMQRHIGDTYILCALKSQIEAKYEAPIHYIIKPSHEIVMKMYGITNYTIFDMDSYIIPYVKDYIKDPLFLEWFLWDYYNSFISSVPAVNNLFIVSETNSFFANYYNKHNDYFKSFIHYWAIAVGLDINKIDIINTNINVPESLIAKIGNIDFNKTILLAPEARSDRMFNKHIWDTICQNLKQKGFIVYENVLDIKNHINGAISLNVTPEELVAFGMNCHSVISIRSGLCDLLSSKGKNLYVLYSLNRIWQHHNKRFLSMKLTYRFKKFNLPKEIIIDKKRLPILIFKGSNLLKGIKQEWLPSSSSYITQLQYIFSIRNEKNYKVIRILGLKIKKRRNYGR